MKKYLGNLYKYFIDKTQDLGLHFDSDYPDKYKTRKTIVIFEDDNTCSYGYYNIDQNIGDLVSAHHINGCVYDCVVTRIDDNKMYIKKLKLNEVFHYFVQREKEKYD